jgi:hypothetical protein
MPTIPAVRRLRQEEYEFEANLGYIVRLSQKTNNNNKSRLIVSTSKYY